MILIEKGQYSRHEVCQNASKLCHRGCNRPLQSCTSRHLELLILTGRLDKLPPNPGDYFDNWTPHHTRLLEEASQRDSSKED